MTMQVKGPLASFVALRARDHITETREQLLTSQQGEVIRSQMKWGHTLLFLCCHNSGASAGLAVQNAGHWSWMPYLCGRSPKPPLHSCVVRPGGGWCGKGTVPREALQRGNSLMWATLLWFISFMLFHSLLHRFQISSWRRESTPSSSGKVGYTAL